MFEPEKGKLSFMQILIAGACASGTVSLLGLQGITRLIAMVVAFVAAGGIMLAISNGNRYLRIAARNRLPGKSC